MALLPHLERNDLDPDGRRVWDLIDDERGDVPASYRSMVHSPGAAEAVARLGSYLRFDSALDARVREVAVMVVNRSTGCEFGQAHHVLLARALGLAEGQIADLLAGRASELGVEERLAARLAEETMRSRRASAETVAAAVEQWGEQQTVDLVVAVGYYTMIAQYCLTMDLTVLPGGLDHLSSGRDVVRARPSGNASRRLGGEDET